MVGLRATEVRSASDRARALDHGFAPGDTAASMRSNTSSVLREVVLDRPNIGELHEHPAAIAAEVVRPRHAVAAHGRLLLLDLLAAVTLDLSHQVQQIAYWVTLALGDDDAGARKLRQQIGRNQLAAGVVAVGVVEQQHAQTSRMVMPGATIRKPRVKRRLLG